MVSWDVSISPAILLSHTGGGGYWLVHVGGGYWLIQEEEDTGSSMNL